MAIMQGCGHLLLVLDHSLTTLGAALAVWYYVIVEPVGLRRWQHGGVRRWSDMGASKRTAPIRSFWSGPTMALRCGPLGIVWTGYRRRRDIMATFAAVFPVRAALPTPSIRPKRLLDTRRVRLFATRSAQGSVGGILLLIALLRDSGPLPSAFAPRRRVSRLRLGAPSRLAQFAGTLLYPPIPSPLTWWLGLAVLFGTFTRAPAWSYAILLTWALDLQTQGDLGLGRTSDWLRYSTANGVHPAIMRNTLPDTGVL
jgi:hypothetical protein